MTSPLPPQPPGRPVVPLLRPLRDLAAYALVAAPAIWLFVAVIRLIPSEIGQDFMTRVQNSFSSFVNVESIVLPIAAVLLATVVQPVHKQARLITIVALVEYAVAGFFAVVFGVLIGVVNIATFSVRTAFEELLGRAAWLAVFAVAGYAVFLIWRNLYYTPKPKAPPGMYGQPAPQWGGQPPYGQPGFPPAGPPGYGPPQPGQPQPGQPHPGQPGSWGQPAQPPPGQPFGAPAWGTPTGPQPVVHPASASPAHPVSAQPGPGPGAPPGPFAPAPGHPAAPGTYGAPAYPPPGYGAPQPPAAQPPAAQPPASQSPAAPAPGGFADPTQAIPHHPDADRTQIVGQDPPPRQ